MSHVNLDDRGELTAHDPMGMHELTAGFADQVAEAVKIARGAALPKWTALPDHVVLTGLGGSAAGGDLVAALFGEEVKGPFLVNRDYLLPAWVGSGSLVFCCSYSGNTEETLAAYSEAKRKGASVIVVSSGGKITELAKADGFPVISVPGGQPPRTAMGYMMMPVVVACEQMGLIPAQDYDEAVEAVREEARLNGFDRVTGENSAKTLAELIHGKMPVFYAASPWLMALAQRWRGQLNENSKVMVGTHFYPELCHNEILGWEGAGDQGVGEWQTVLLVSGNESGRMTDRIRITSEAISEAAGGAFVVGARGTRVLSQLLSLAHIGDWLSLYVAALRGVDPGQMVAIDQLKEELAKLDS